MVFIYVQMAEIQLHVESEDSDLESPVPKRMRQEFEEKTRREEATVETTNGWVSEDGKTRCTVPACNGETFSRFTSFRKHWALKHRRLIDVFTCTDCPYKSADVWDVKRHMTAQHQHHEELWLKSQKMKNNKFMDPGILNSPSKLSNKTRQPFRERQSRQEETNNQDRNSTEGENGQHQDSPASGTTEESTTMPAMPAPETNHHQLLLKAAEAKRLKEKYAQEETEFRTQFEKHEARKWYKLYCQEKDQRRRRRTISST